MEAEEKVPETTPVVDQTAGEPTDAELNDDLSPEGEVEEDDDAQ